MSVLGVLASGRGSNCRSLLRAVDDGRLQATVALVLSDREDAPVLEHARAAGVNAAYLDPGRRGARLSPEAEAEYVRVLREAGVEWVALAGFMRILGDTFLGGYAGRVVNIHPSLLPAFPGLDAQGQAFDYGVKVAGATVHFVDGGVDTGPVIDQATVAVRDDDTSETLAARILEAEHELYPRALSRVLSGTHRLEGRRVIWKGDKQ